MSGDNPQQIDPETSGESLTNVPGAVVPIQDRNDEGDQTASLRDPVATLQPGDNLAGRYKVLRLIGRGGMGEVYEASDALLGETIALKIINGMAARDNRARLRFKREIQLARKVTHTNVCRTFDLVVSDAPNGSGEVLFLTMELLYGETLAQRLKRDGRLDIREAKPIIEQIAAGLSAAHNAGVIHRDLKLGNIFLARSTSGFRTVVTDFGLARSQYALESADESISLNGEVIGTPEYLAPEQLQGKEATSATDIYALGTVMFALITGKLPFQSQDRVTAATRRLYESPPTPQSYYPELDTKWNDAILRCLAREPEKRFATADDVAHAIQSPSSYEGSRRMSMLALAAIFVGALACVWAAKAWLWPLLHSYDLPARKQLAILPFSSLDGTPESAAFARGIAETLTIRLIRLTRDPQLQILPADELRGRHIETAREARREFGVNLGIQGTVARNGSRRRITYQLVDATDSHAIYGETITSEDADLFKLEDEIARSVENSLRVAIGFWGAKATAELQTQPRAYDFYLQGRGYMELPDSPQNVDSAIGVFSRAIRIDSHYAPAYAGLGQAYWTKFEETHDSSWVSRAKESCGKAVALDGGEAEGHVCLGTVNEGTDDYAGAASEFDQALKTEPDNDAAIRGQAAVFASLGRFDEAERAHLRAIQTRPGYWGGYNRLGGFYFGRGRLMDAGRMYQQVIALSPDNYLGYSNLGAVLLLNGAYKDAIPLFERASTVRPTADEFSNLGSAYFYLHQFSDASHAFDRAVQIDNRDYVFWGNWAEADIQMPERRTEAENHYKKAIQLAQERLKVTPKDSVLLGNLAQYYSALHEKPRAYEYLKKLMGTVKDNASASFVIATVYSRFEEKDLALKWLSTALQQGYSRNLIRDSPAFFSLRGDRRFEDALNQSVQ